MTQDITYFESGYIVNDYFIYTADAEAQLESTVTIDVHASIFNISNIKEFAADLTTTATSQATGTIVFRPTILPFAYTYTNTGGASALDGVSSGLGITTYSYFGGLKIDAGPLVQG